MKLAILTMLSVRLQGIIYIHSVVNHNYYLF